MTIDGVEVKAGDRVAVRMLEWTEPTLWQKLRWKLRRPLRRYPDPNPNGIYELSGGSCERRSERAKARSRAS